ncbi:MAG TPA: PQQ-binding-like beta-propeller repeat protein, partial [Candidatus Bathyarchaeia archaeon]|nr:PQQ-binding-like beta-propeller repeat protein [Candidatus Bathyarchaeia archaeon]
TTVGSILALNGEGLEIWRYDTQEQLSIPPTLADVTGGTGLEVVVLANSGRIYCLEGGNGAVLWQTNLLGPVEWGRTAVVAADLDGNHSLELLATDSRETLSCLTGEGKLVWAYKHPGILNSYPAVDLSYMKIFIGAMDTPLLCISHEGKELWRLPNEGATGSSPFVVDLAGQDNVPELLIGIGNGIAAVDSQGKMLWTYPMRRDVDCAIAAADADRDGVMEVYAADLGGKFVCLSPDGGLRWEADVEQRVRRNPTIADIDGDGVIEILLAGYSKKLYVFDPKGLLEETISLDGESNATPTVIDFGGDGRLAVVLPVTTGKMQAFQWAQQKPDPTVLVAEFRLNSARTGSPGQPEHKPPVNIHWLDCGDYYAGPNTFKAAVENRENHPIEVDLAVLRDGEKFSGSNLASSERNIEARVLYTLDGAAPVTLTFVCTVSEAGQLLAERRHQVYLTPFTKELADLGRLADEIRDALPQIESRHTPENILYRIQARLAELKEHAMLAGAMSGGERTALADEFAELRAAAVPMAAMARAAVMRGSSVAAFPANPWAPFGGADELADTFAGRGQVRIVPRTELVLGVPDCGSIHAFIGEVESAAFNLFNFSDRPRAFRVYVEPLKQGDVQKHAVTAREVLPVPTQMLDYAWDALPLLNEANAIIVPPWDARQVWLTIDATELTPGSWDGELKFRSLDVESVTAVATFGVEVYNAHLPEKQPLRLCHWGYVHTSVLKDQPQAALDDQVSHGTNVFVGIQFPQATCDDAGNLVGPIDFVEHDDYVKRYAPHGMILFCGYQGALKGAPQSSDGWKKAHVQYLRQWVAHLAQLGVGYDGFALYPVDEPGLNPGLSDIHIAMGKLAREADPKIRMYTDPVGRCTMEELRAMAPYVDIWCPNRNGYLIKQNQDKLEFIKSTGAQVWTYECDDNAKHQSALGYYRGQAWLAWHYGLTGIGFWSYCTSKDDPWYRADREYLLIYQGNGVVPSKRWEAIRDGIEDYSMLCVLRDAAGKAEREGRAPKTVEQARNLLGEEASQIANFCGRDQDGTVPGSLGPAGDRAVAWKRWCRIRDTRAKMAQLLESLKQ